MFNFWKFKLKLDDFFFEFVNLILYFIHAVNSISGKRKYLKKNIELKNKHKNQPAFLVANGPSVKNQDLTLLKDKLTVFVNRSYLHEDYKLIKPTYHVFIDNKLVNGEWPIECLDQIIELNPEVVFLLSYKWRNNPILKNYVNNKKFKIYWIDTTLFFTPFFHKSRMCDLTKRTLGGAVTGASLSALLYMGSKDIYLIGKDGNGLCYELTKKDSHFYGVNPENDYKTIHDIQQDLYMMSTGIKNWISISEYCIANEISVTNLTHGGIFDMFERKDFHDTLNNFDL